MSFLDSYIFKILIFLTSFQTNLASAGDYAQSIVTFILAGDFNQAPQFNYMGDGYARPEQAPADAREITPSFSASIAENSPELAKILVPTLFFLLFNFLFLFYIIKILREINSLVKKAHKCCDRTFLPENY